VEGPRFHQRTRPTGSLLKGNRVHYALWKSLFRFLVKTHPTWQSECYEFRENHLILKYFVIRDAGQHSGTSYFAYIREQFLTRGH
jgi:hypothetical protein